MADEAFTRIETERLVLRRFASSDAAALSAYRSEPDTARYQGWEAPFPLADAEAFIAEMAALDPDTEGEWYQFAVALRDGGALIGDVAMRPLDGDPDTVEVGYTLAAAYTGQGYAGEAVAAIVDYAFTARGKTEVMGWTDTRNTRSAALLVRLGFTHDPASRHRSLFKGEWCDDDRYVMTPADWESRQLSRLSS